MGEAAEVLLVAEDDDDDFFLTQEALRDCGCGARVLRVRDGEELLDYLLRRGAYAGEGSAPEPRLILLDLNMPKRDGREALREMKSHPVLHRIPVLILSTSASHDDVRLAYDLGVNAFIRKPMEYPRYVSIVRATVRFWLETAEGPPVATGREDEA